VKKAKNVNEQIARNARSVARLDSSIRILGEKGLKVTAMSVDLWEVSATLRIEPVKAESTSARPTPRARR